jgi:hypothetical protein
VRITQINVIIAVARLLKEQQKKAQQKKCQDKQYVLKEEIIQPAARDAYDEDVHTKQINNQPTKKREMASHCVALLI